MADSHYQSTLDAVYVYVVPWPEFSGDHSVRQRAHLRGASLGARLSGGQHGPIIVLVTARVSQDGGSSLINPVIRNQDC